MFVIVGGCTTAHGDPSALPPEGAGTAKADASGKITGTGWIYYYYPDGKSVKAKDAYKDGRPVYSAWLKPDGQTLGATYWVNGTGIQLYLWDDGSIKTMMPMANGVANGMAIYFTASGAVEKRVEFRNGQPVQN